MVGAAYVVAEGQIFTERVPAELAAKPEIRRAYLLVARMSNTAGAFPDAAKFVRGTVYSNGRLQHREDGGQLYAHVLDGGDDGY
jgi:hypothetical protein